MFCESVYAGQWYDKILISMEKFAERRAAGGGFAVNGRVADIFKGSFEMQKTA